MLEWSGASGPVWVFFWWSGAVFLWSGALPNTPLMCCPVYASSNLTLFTSPVKTFPLRNQTTPFRFGSREEQNRQKRKRERVDFTAVLKLVQSSHFGLGTLKMHIIVLKLVQQFYHGPLTCSEFSSRSSYSQTTHDDP